jgi:hypothetical protein
MQGVKAQIYVPFSEIPSLIYNLFHFAAKIPQATAAFKDSAPPTRGIDTR